MQFQFGSFSGGQVVTWAPWRVRVVEHPDVPRPNLHEPMVLATVEHALGRCSVFWSRRRCDTGELTAGLVGRHVVIALGDGTDLVRLLRVTEGVAKAPPRVRVQREANEQGTKGCIREG